MKITRITFWNFEEIIVIGEINKSDRAKIKTILDTMSMDSYGGYSPAEQEKRTEIMNITNRYEKPVVRVIM